MKIQLQTNSKDPVNSISPVFKNNKLIHTSTRRIEQAIFKISVFLALLIVAIVLSNCTQKKHFHEYYIVSTGDSTNFTNKSPGTDEYIELPPPPPPPPPLDIIIEGGQFYFNMTIIFDSTDLVYLYQTDIIENNESVVKVPFRGCIVDASDDYYKFIKYPGFIELKTENLMKFDNKDFINFVCANIDIFQFNNPNCGARLFIIASNKDTITNPAFYDFMSLIRLQQETENSVYYHIRRTTEEEDTVIFYKRRNLKYNPNSIVWSKNFLSGEYAPFTKAYDSIVNTVIPIKHKARSMFRPDYKVFTEN